MLWEALFSTGEDMDTGARGATDAPRRLQVTAGERQPSRPSGATTRAADQPRTESASYKWIVLSNTTLGVLMATINSSILLISLPAIFRGIAINPLGQGNVSYLLWMIMGF